MHANLGGRDAGLGIWDIWIYGYGYGYLSVFVWAPNMDGMFAADRIEESSGRMLTGCRFDGDDSIYSIRVCLLCKLGRVAYGNKETKLSICVSMKVEVCIQLLIPGQYP